MRVDFAQKIRPIGQLNGANNGPLHTFTDRTAEYKDMGIDFVRFHETHAYNTKCIEVPFVFRNFDADENDPANYYFAETDAVIKAAHDAGMEIMYRLGMGTEGTQPKIFCVIPPDYEKWARIAEHIVMHYNEGWANGFHYDIPYWEIWNEPDLFAYWPGPRLEFVKFYGIVYNHLKAKFPHLKIGAAGFASTRRLLPPPDASADKVAEWQDHRNLGDRLMEGVRDGKYGMDFFAFHSYHADIPSCRGRLERGLSLLEDYGLLGKIEIINTEWNGISLKRDQNGVWYMGQMYTAHSMIDVLASMLVYQKAGVSKAAYYAPDERNTFCGLYHFDGTPKNHYYSLKAFKLLRQGDTEVFSDGDTDTIVAAASIGKEKAVVVICNEGEDAKFPLKLENLPECKYTLTLLDETHKLDVVRRGKFTGRALSVDLKRDSAWILEFDLASK